MGSKKQRVVVDPASLNYLQGKNLVAPSNVIPELEQIHGPDKLLHGKFKGKDKDPSHKDCVLVKFKEDPRTFFFDIDQVYEWIEEPKDGKRESLDEPSAPEPPDSRDTQAPSGTGLQVPPRSAERAEGADKEKGKVEEEVKKRRGRPPMGSSGPGEETPLAGKDVMVPSTALVALEEVHGPGKWLHGKVKGRDKDPAHPNCVLVKCKEDKRTFFFDSDQVQEWIEAGEMGLQPSPPIVETDGPGLPKRTTPDFSLSHFPQLPQLLYSAHLGGAGVGAGHMLPPKEEQEPRTREEEEDMAMVGRWGGKRPRVDAGRRVPSNRLPGEPVRQRPPMGPPERGVTSKAEVADIIGKEVEIPGTVFNDFTPGHFLRGRIIGPDSAHAGAVEVRLINDRRRLFYFHASEARDWLRMQHLRAMIASHHDQGSLSDRVAAEVLARMSAGESRDNGGGRTSPTTSGHTTSHASPHPSALRPLHVHRVQPRPVSAAPTLPMLPALQTGPAMNGGLDANGFLPGTAQSPQHPHHRAAMRTSAINYSRPLGLPSLESMGAGEGVGDGAAGAAPATATLPMLQHPLPAERRKRQRELLSQSNAGGAPTVAGAAAGEQAGGAGDVQQAAMGGDGQGGGGGQDAAAEGLQGQGEPAAAAPAAAGEPGMLRWGCTELLAQHESLLPAPLAEHLAHICALHDAKMAALEEAERMASQVEGGMRHQNEAHDLQGSQQ